MKNSIINTYNTVYGVDIVIANKYATLDDLKKDLVYTDGEELEESLLNYQAVTTRCKNRNTNRYCILVKYNNDSTIKGINKTLDIVNTAAHEALHAALDLYSFAQDSINPDDRNEHLAYLVGWLTECIYSTWTRNE